VIGTCLASDFLVAATAMIPLAVTALLAGARRDRRCRLLALSALTTIAVAVATAKLTSTTMGSLGYRTLPTPFRIAPFSELPGRAELLFKGLKALFNGYLGTAAPGVFHTPLGIASDIVMSAALLALLILGVRATIKLVSSGLRKHSASMQTPAQLACSLHIIYWASSAASACGAFWLAGEGPTTAHESYYATVIFSVAAVVPLTLSMGSRVRGLIVAGTSIFFAASLVGLTSNNINQITGPMKASSTITQIAQANHLQVGYSSYGDATGLTWGTHEHVVVRPVVECPNRGGANLCPGFQDYILSWYVPRQRHSFLLIDAHEPEIRGVPKGLGKPLAAYGFESMRMYIYPYDIASRLGSALE